MKEEWRGLPGLPDYEISNLARCRRTTNAPYGVRKGFLLKPSDVGPNKSLVYKMYPSGTDHKGVSRTIAGLMKMVWPDTAWQESKKWMDTTIKRNDKDNKTRRERKRYKPRKPKKEPGSKYCICGNIKTNRWMSFCMECSRGVEVTVRVRESRVLFSDIKTGVHGLDCNDPLFNPFPT